jgi:regulator of protease activity HflC (stomatin/prohibitin superfamily)
MPGGLWVVIFLAGLVLLVISKTARVVPQQSAYVVERLSTFPEQVCITRDNVQVGVDGVIYLKVMNPERASYGVQDYFFAISQLAQTTLRSEVGKIDLDRTFEERSHINGQVVSELDKASEPWGVKVLRYEIKNIVPPKDVLSAMEKQMRAEREKRAVILTSEGERDARINEAEGEKQQVIKASEATRQRQINEAEGQARRSSRSPPPPPRDCAGRRDDPEPGRPRGGAAARRRAVGHPVRAPGQGGQHAGGAREPHGSRGRRVSGRT